jgi:thiamine-phosphate pyrophosphorylase
MTTLHNSLIDYSLYFVTDESLSKGRSTVSIAEQALSGGATVIQLRDKGKDRDYLRRTGFALRELCNRYNALFIVNDDVDLACECNADGIHIGQSDLSCTEARKLNSSKIIGISTTTVAESVRAQFEGADYLGVGPVFATSSKDDAVPPIGLSGLAEIVSSVRIPVIAIGGISAHNASDIAKTGASGIAVISALSMADSVIIAAQSLRESFTSGKL